MSFLPLSLSLAAAMNFEPSSPERWISSSISITAWFAPPCSGPHNAHTPAAALANKIRLARRHHAHGRGGTILLVIRVQQKNQVQRLHHFRLEFKILIRRREQHVQEIGGVFVGLLRINQRQPVRFAVGIRRNGAHLRNQLGHINVEFLRSCPIASA